MWPFKAKTRDTRKGVFRVGLSDGTEREYDPFRLRLELNRALPDWAAKVEEVAKLARPLPAGSPPHMVQSRADAHAVLALDLAGAVSRAFGLPELTPDGGGFTVAERIGVLGAFLGYLAKVMEDTRPLASPPAGSVPAGGN